MRRVNFANFRRAAHRCCYVRNANLVFSIAHDLQTKLILRGQFTQHRKNRFQIRKGRMRPDPSDHDWIALGSAWRRPKESRVNHGWNDPGARSLTLNVFCNRAVAASDYRGPPNQIVRLAEPLQSGAKAAIG